MKKPHFAIGKRKARSDRRRALQAELAKAIRDRDLDLAEQLQEQLDAVAPKSNGRSSSSICRDPYDPELVELYKDKLVHEILAEFGKEIRVDFGFLGMVTGIVNIVDSACEALGERVSPPLRKEVARGFARKFVQRTHGMGMLYTERANQVVRKLYEQPDVVKALGLPMGERPWIKRRPPSEQVDFDADFARRWEDFEAQGIDTEDTEDTNGVETNAAATDASKTEPAKPEAVAEETKANDAKAPEPTEGTEPTEPPKSVEPTDTKADSEKDDDSPDPSKLDLTSLLD